MRPSRFTFWILLLLLTVFFRTPGGNPKAHPAGHTYSFPKADRGIVSTHRECERKEIQNSVALTHNDHTTIDITCFHSTISAETKVTLVLLDEATGDVDEVTEALGGKTRLTLNQPSPKILLAFLNNADTVPLGKRLNFKQGEAASAVLVFAETTQIEGITPRTELAPNDPIDAELIVDLGAEFRTSTEYSAYWTGLFVPGNWIYHSGGTLRRQLACADDGTFTLPAAQSCQQTLVCTIGNRVVSKRYLEGTRTLNLELAETDPQR